VSGGCEPATAAAIDEAVGRGGMGGGVSLSSGGSSGSNLYSKYSFKIYTHKSLNKGLKKDFIVSRSLIFF
jgi:hypothetical protein